MQMFHVKRARWRPDPLHRLPFGRVGPSCHLLPARRCTVPTAARCGARPGRRRPEAGSVRVIAFRDALNPASRPRSVGPRGLAVRVVQVVPRETPSHASLPRASTRQCRDRRRRDSPSSRTGEPAAAEPIASTSVGRILGCPRCPPTPDATTFHVKLHPWSAQATPAGRDPRPASSSTPMPGGTLRPCTVHPRSVNHPESTVRIPRNRSGAPPAAQFMWFADRPRDDRLCRSAR